LLPEEDTGGLAEIDTRLLFLADEDALKRVPKSRLFLAGAVAKGALFAAGLGTGGEDKEAAPPTGIEGLPGFTVTLGASCGATPGADNGCNNLPDVLL